MPNAYDCVYGGGIQSCARTQKKILDHKISIFVQKKLLHWHLLLCIENCKLVLSYK